MDGSWARLCRLAGQYEKFSRKIEKIHTNHHAQKNIPQIRAQPDTCFGGNGKSFLGRIHNISFDHRFKRCHAQKCAGHFGALSTRQLGNVFPEWGVKTDININLCF